MKAQRFLTKHQPMLADANSDGHADVLVWAAGDHTVLLAIDGRSGRLLWQVDVGKIHEEQLLAAVVRDVVLVALPGGVVEAREVGSGKRRWRRQIASGEVEWFCDFGKGQSGAARDPGWPQQGPLVAQFEPRSGRELPGATEERCAAPWTTLSGSDPGARWWGSIRGFGIDRIEHYSPPAPPELERLRSNLRPHWQIDVDVTIQASLRPATFVLIGVRSAHLDTQPLVAAADGQRLLWEQLLDSRAVPDHARLRGEHLLVVEQGTPQLGQRLWSLDVNTGRAHYTIALPPERREVAATDTELFLVTATTISVRAIKNGQVVRSLPLATAYQAR